jgi:hypothetical protein
MILWQLFFWLAFAAACSVGWDLATYEQRQTRWEKAHPRTTYRPRSR